MVRRFRDFTLYQLLTEPWDQSSFENELRQMQKTRKQGAPLECGSSSYRLSRRPHRRAECAKSPAGSGSVHGVAKKR